MEVDLLGFFKDRMARAYEEQVWAVALIGAMNGFIISKVRDLVSAIKPSIIILGTYVTTALALLFIWSRHAVFVHYDDLAKRIMDKTASGILGRFYGVTPAASELAGWSGVVLYSLLVIGMTYASICVLKSGGSGK